MEKNMQNLDMPDCGDDYDYDFDFDSQMYEDWGSDQEGETSNNMYSDNEMVGSYDNSQEEAQLKRKRKESQQGYTYGKGMEASSSNHELMSDFWVYSNAQVLEKINELVQQTNGILEVGTDVTHLLLKEYGYNQEKLIEASYTSGVLCATNNSQLAVENDLEIASSGEKKRYLDVYYNSRGIFKNFVCAIMGEQPPAPENYNSNNSQGGGYSQEGVGGVEPLKVFGTYSCPHYYCKDCYYSYVAHKIRGGEANVIGCMGYKCKSKLAPGAIGFLISSNGNDKDRRELKEKYEKQQVEEYVNSNKHMKFCPAPGCEYAIEWNSSSGGSSSSNRRHIGGVIFSGNGGEEEEECKLPQIAKCKCGFKFCFDCGEPQDHFPVLCTITKRWIQKCKDDSETANYLAAFTKDCPNCMSAIEKNGGCNHMTCKKCRYEFCWLCKGKWQTHGAEYYKCNKYSDVKKSGEETVNKSREALERYLHYYARYTNHEQSIVLMKRLLEKTQLRMEQAQSNTALTWIDVQFLADAVEIIAAARSVLKWTYAFAYYMVKDNMNIIFEDNQADLESATEQLNGLIETENIDWSNIADLKQQILNLSTYVKTRQKVMVDDIVSGYLESRFSFVFDVSEF